MKKSIIIGCGGSGLAAAIELVAERMSNPIIIVEEQKQEQRSQFEPEPILITNNRVYDPEIFIDEKDLVPFSKFRKYTFKKRGWK